MTFQSSLRQQAGHATTLAIIRMKVIEALRQRGVAARKEDATTLVLESGARFALNNLLVRCSTAGRSAWDSIIDGYLDVMLEMMRQSEPSFISDLADSEFYSRLRERVVAPSALDAIDAYDYSLPLLDVPDAPRRVLNLSFPSSAVTLADRHLEGRDVSAAWAAGRKNTAAGKFDTGKTLSRHGVDIEVLSGDSIYLASKVADMPTLISTHLGECLYGVLFAVPSAYEMAVHRPRCADGALAAAAALTELADMFSRDTPSPLSRSVFFWRDGEYCRVADESTGIFASTLAELRANH